jgi:hypothetical protein
MIKLLGVEVSNKAIVKTQIHNAVEIVGMAVWLQLVLTHHGVAGFIVLAATLTIEHILSLAAGKQA